MAALNRVSIGVDPELLESQAASLGTVLDSTFGQTMPAAIREDLVGIWNLLHAVLDTLPGGGAAQACGCPLDYRRACDDSGEGL